MGWFGLLMKRFTVLVLSIATNQAKYVSSSYCRYEGVLASLQAAALAAHSDPGKRSCPASAKRQGGWVVLSTRLYDFD